MSHVETSRAAYEAFARGDVEAAFADLHDDCVFHGNGAGLPGGGDYRGRQEILATWLQEIMGGYDQLTVTPTQFIDAGEHVVVLGEDHATVRGTPIDGRFCHVWRYDDDGKVVEAFFFEDTGQTVRAMAGAKAAAVS